MAANKASKYLEDLVTCPVCLDVFSDPHTLLCLHTFCHKCVLAISDQHPNQVIACPACRAETELGQIKHDFLIAQVMNVHLYMTSQRRKVKYMCNDTGNLPDDICQMCDSNVSSDICRKCSGLFCFSCLKGHRKFTDCLEEDVESLDERSNYCVEELQKLKKLVLGNTTELQKQLDEKSVQSQEERNKVKNDLGEFFVRIVDEVDNLANQHMKKLEVQHNEKLKKMNDLNGLLSVTLCKSKAGVVKAFGSFSNQVQNELTEHGHLDCPPLKIAVNNPCLNDHRVHVSVSDQIRLVDLVDKNLNVTCTLHIPNIVGRVQVIQGDYWCSFESQVLVLNCYGETINTINVHRAVCIALSDTNDIIILSYTHGIYKMDLNKGSATRLSKIRHYDDIWIGGGHHCAVHFVNGKLCLDELNEDYQIVQHKGTRVTANKSFGLQLAIVDKSAFVSSAQFNLVQIDLGSGDIVKEFNCKVSYPMFTDGHHLLISQQTSICLFKPEDGSLTPLKLPSDMGNSYICAISGKKLFVHYFDDNVKYWRLAVLTY